MTGVEKTVSACISKQQTQPATGSAMPWRDSTPDCVHCAGAV